MMIHSYDDDNGVTIAKRPYVTAQEREAAFSEITQLVEGKTGEWIDSPPGIRSASDPFGQRGAIAFVVEVDQSEYLATLRDKLTHLANTAKTSAEFADGCKTLCGKIAACNHNALVGSVNGINKIFEARFSKTIGRVGERLDGNAVRFSDFDTIKINSEGVTYQNFGEVRHIALKDLIDVKVYAK